MTAAVAVDTLYRTILFMTLGRTTLSYPYGHSRKLEPRGEEPGRMAGKGRAGEDARHLQTFPRLRARRGQDVQHAERGDPPAPARRRHRDRRGRDPRPAAHCGA